MVTAIDDNTHIVSSVFLADFLAIIRCVQLIPPIPCKQKSRYSYESFCFPVFLDFLSFLMLLWRVFLSLRSLSLVVLICLW